MISTCLAAVDLAVQVEPWFSSPGLAGAIFGGGVGVLASLYGTLVGVLAPQGRGRALVFGLHWGLLAMGVVLLAAGLTALNVGQPFGVWYPLLLPGAIVTGLILSFTPMVRLRYRQAEHRRLEAGEFRRA